jgi:hypothetical protein
MVTLLGAVSRLRLGEAFIADSFTIKDRNCEVIIIGVHESKYSRRGITFLDKYIVQLTVDRRIPMRRRSLPYKSED